MFLERVCVLFFDTFRYIKLLEDRLFYDDLLQPFRWHYVERVECDLTYAKVNKLFHRDAHLLQEAPSTVIYVQWLQSRHWNAHCYECVVMLLIIQVWQNSGCQKHQPFGSFGIYD